MLDLLSRLESNPAARFSEATLTVSYDAFETCLRLGLLVRCEVPDHSFSAQVGGRLLTVVKDHDGFIGIDADSDELDMVELTPAEIVRWKFDIDALARLVVSRNGLSGQPERVSPRLWFTGIAPDNRACFIGFFSDSGTLLQAATWLAAKLGGTYKGLVIVLPCLTVPPSAATDMAMLRVTAVALRPDLTFPRPSTPASGFKTAKTGRRLLEDDPAARQLYEEGEALRVKHPGITREQIAVHLKLSASTYRRYVTRFRKAGPSRS